jgi:carotenoid cleavage dioxygenase-like enzyme
VGYVYDGGRAASHLVLVDAATLETVASVNPPVRVPYGFHGNWIPDHRAAGRHLPRVSDHKNPTN